MGQDTLALAADDDTASMPLGKRKSLQELVDGELLRQCSTGTCSSPVSWMHGDDMDATLACNRKAAKILEDGADSGGNVGAAVATASPPVSVPPPTSGAGALDACLLPPRSSLPPGLLRTCGGSGGGACSMSVYCSASFGALDEDDDDAAGPDACGASEASMGGSVGSTAAAAELEELDLEFGLDSANSNRWPELPDDILRKVLDRLPLSYLRVVRLVCRQWEGAAGRLLRHLRPETLVGKAVGSRFCHLHSLDLSHCMGSVEFVAPKRLRLQSRLTDELLAELVPLSKLRQLSLRNCVSMSGTGLLHLVSLPELRVLDLSNCSQLSDAGLACAAQLPRLETLNLQGCTGISDVGLMRLWGMPRLRHVICHNTITDVGLHILTGITGLERVALHDCRSVSRQGVVALLQMTSLKRVVISKCPQVTLESLCGTNLRVISDLRVAAAAQSSHAAAMAAAAVVAGAAGAAAAGQWHNPALLPDLQLLMADLA